MKIKIAPNVSFGGYNNCIYVINEENETIHLLTDSSKDFWKILDEEDDFEKIILYLDDLYKDISINELNKDFKELVDNLVKTITSFDGILGIHDLVIHSYGETRIFSSVHIEFAAEGDFIEAHETADTIERVVKEKFGIELVVHLDPIVTNDIRINALNTMVKNELIQIDSSLTMHDFRVVDGPTRTNLIFDVVISHDSQKSEEEITNELKERISQLDTRYALVIMYDNDYLCAT